MAVKTKITEKSPRTGALPSEQTASANGVKSKQDGNPGLTESERLIYQLVENNVSFAGEEFAKNLRFNSEVLTNVLYDNIYSLLGEKFNEDDFVKWVADKLVEQGMVYRGDQKTPSTQQNQEYANVEDSETEYSESSEPACQLDTSEYDQLISQVHAAVELIKASRYNILKILMDTSDAAMRQKNQTEKTSDYQDKSSQERDKHIQDLVTRISTNQSGMQNYVQSSFQQKNRLDDAFGVLTARLGSELTASERAYAGNMGMVSAIKTDLGRFGKKFAVRRKTVPMKPDVKDVKSGKITFQQLYENPNVLKRALSPYLKPSTKRPNRLSSVSAVMGAASPARQISGARMFRRREPPRLGRNVGGADAKPRSLLGGQSGKSLRGRLVHEVPLKRGKTKLKLNDRIKRRMKLTGVKIVRKISNSGLGKGYRAVKNAVVSAAMAVKKTVGFVYGVVRKIATVAYKTVKTTVLAAGAMARGFIKTSHAVGRMAFMAGKSVVKAGKKFVANVKSGKLKDMIMDFNGAKIINRLGWKFIKFVGRKLWSGLKKLAFKSLTFFAGMFALVGKFKNKIGTWMTLIGKWVRDRTYRFVVKPISEMLVQIVDFFMGVVASPIRFIKWMAVTVFDKVRAAVNAMKTASRRVLKRTWGMFKRIVFNPLTLAVLVGGIFLLFRKSLFGWLGKMVSGIRNNVVPVLKTLMTSAFRFIKGVWGVVSVISKFMFKLVKWLTDPGGWIMSTIKFVIGTFLLIKKGISKMGQVAGFADNIDMLCMFIAGDRLGLAMHFIMGAVVKVWNYIQRKGFIKTFFNLIKGIFKVYAMIWAIPFTILESIGRAVACALQPWKWSKIGEQFAMPWKRWWGAVKRIFNGEDVNIEQMPLNEPLSEDPTHFLDQNNARANIAIRNLGMKGKPEKSLAALERLANFNQARYGKLQSGELLRRLQSMNRLREDNANQANAYNSFMQKLWEMGSGSEIAAQAVLKQMLESPEISQRLLSVFFYLDPQTGDTMMLRPSSDIGKFVENIRKAMSSVNRDDLDIFRQLVQEFDQLNKERTQIVNDQANIIADFAERINRFDPDVRDLKANGTVELTELLQKFSKGKLFESIHPQRYYNQIKDGEARTAHLTSVTGEKFGAYKLLDVKTMDSGSDGPKYKASDFKMTVPSPESSGFDTGNVTMPFQVKSPTTKMSQSSRSLFSEWFNNQEKRRQIIGEKGEAAADAAGYERLTFEEYKKRHARQSEEVEQDSREAERRKAALRMVYDIQAWQSQGKIAKAEGFVLRGVPSIIQIPTDNLSGVLYMFSPDWMKINGASKLSDAELFQIGNQLDSKTQEKIRKAQKEERMKKEAEDRQRRREQEVLDFSAKVKDGFIEVKIGEDVTAMHDAWFIHQEKRREFLAMPGHTEELADSMGLRRYTWEEWKKYYRKMHGLPEDGIRRIPFKEQLRKPRQIDWSERFPLSVEEMSKFGIEVSEDGPVMIPLDKAMSAAQSLLSGAKTMYSVRDGLEVMRRGLDSETIELRKRNRQGITVGVVQTRPDDGYETVDGVPASPSQYSEVG